MEKLSYVLGSELWESKFGGLLSLVKEYIIDVWEIRKHKLYDSDQARSQGEFGGFERTPPPSAKVRGF